MSLVNDALKRAKEAHDKQTGTPLRGAPLHTVPPPPASKIGLIALACFVLASVAAVGILYSKKNLLPQWGQTKPATAPAPASIIIIGANLDAAAKPNPAPMPVAVAATPATGKPTPAVGPATISEPAAKALVVDKRPAQNIVPPPAVVAPRPAPPQTLKLQGILFSASKPAAILNGHTYYVGDRIGNVTISAIEADRLTVIYSNQPVVIRMP